MRTASALMMALLGYAAAIAVISSVAVASVIKLDHAATDRFVAVRSHEQRLTVSERLRWMSEHLTATGRGYLIAGGPSFRERLEEITSQFATLRHDLHRTEDDARGLQLLAEIDSAAVAYDNAQDEIIALKQDTDDTAALERQFERELLPLRRKLDRAIDAYVERQDAILGSAYDLLDERRARATQLALASVTLAAILGGILVVAVSRRLARTYRREQAALAQAEVAIAARDEILGIVAHDLRNPLSAITGRAALLQTKTDPEAVRQQAEFIQTAAMRMNNLIAKLLDVSTMDAGHFSVKRKACPLDDIVHDAVDLFERMAANKSVELRASGDASGALVDADKEQIIRVMANLLGNAIKFTPENGKVDLRVDRAGQVAHFSVSDTGPGILPEHLPHVFDRFWREDRPSLTPGRSRTKGTGLGLYIAKGIIEAHGGRLWAESEPGAGATFHFTLRVVEADAAQPTPPEPERESSHLH